MIEAILFITGAGIMILELVGSRILAPYIGTSIFVWTSLIGVILGSLSLGYLLGGKRADRNSSQKEFACIVLAGGIAIIFSLIVKNAVLEALLGIHDVRIAAPLAVLALFAPASALLGAVSPYGVRLKIKTVGGSGSVVGKLYAVSTAGSIFGTFAAGFYLIPNFSSTGILIFLGALLSIAAIAALPGYKLKTKILLAFLAALAGFALRQGLEEPRTYKGKIIEANADTAYNRVLILSGTDPETNRPARYLITDPAGLQSGMFLDRDDELVFEYTKFYRLAGYFNPEIEKALMIGGGGYSYPKDFLKKFPRSKIDVVEIDPQLTELAKKYFNLKDDPRLAIYHEDGRNFINSATGKYGAIFIDAFNGCSPAYGLSTKEAVQRMMDLLEENGIVVMNVVSSLSGSQGKFLRAEYATYKSVFPQVLLFPVFDNQREYLLQNVMLVALKRDRGERLISADKEFSSYLSHLWSGAVKKDVPPLTDDYAPVEYYYKDICSQISV